MNLQLLRAFDEARIGMTGAVFVNLIINSLKIPETFDVWSLTDI